MRASILTVVSSVLLSSSAQAGVELAHPFHLEVLTAGPPIVSVSSLDVSADGMLFVGDAGGHKVLRIEPKSRSTKVVAEGLPLSAVGQVLARSPGAWFGDDLVIADWNSGGSSACCDGRVLRIERSTGAISTIVSGNPLFSSSGDVAGIAYAQGGAFGEGLFALDFQGASVNPPFLYRVDSAGGSTPFLVDPSTWNVDQLPKKLAFDEAGTFGGDLFVADPSPAQPTIWRVTPNSTVSPFVTSDVLGAPTALAFGRGGAFGDDLYLVDSGLDASRILRVSPSGTVTTVVTGLPGVAVNDLAGIAFAGDGASMFVGIGDVIFHVSPDVPWTILGGDVGGPDGAPCLLGSGLLIPGDPAGIRWTNAPASTPAFLIIGTTSLVSPLFGGLLVPKPDLVIAGIPVGSDGTRQLMTAWPNGVATGASFYFQVWSPDASAPAGYAGSNGLRAQVP